MKKQAISYQRFSSIAQGTEGKDSRQRQSRAIDLALKKHGLILDGEFHDWGRSAYHKRHIAKGGGLHELRRLAVAGKLKGKVLVIENWDRYGRLQATDACPLLMDMLNGGVDVVAGSDGGDYFSREVVNANPFLLYRAIDEMNRGFGESKRKSEMAKAKWQSRKEAITAGKFVPLNSLPWWLTNGKDKYEFKQGMRELIRKIFKIYLSGLGSQTVAILLNKENIPLPPTKNGGNRTNANGWHATYIQKLIKNRALLGYYSNTDCKIFPPAVTEHEFYTANKKRMDRKCFAGRRAQHINPFMGLCLCAKCGGHIITHHSGVKKYGSHPYSYLQCSNSRRGRCSAAGIPFRVFEESFSILWEDKKVMQAFAGDNEEDNSKSIELEGKLGVISSRLKQIKDDYLAAPSNTLAGIMATLEQEEIIVKKELENVTIKERGTVSTNESWKNFYDATSIDWEKRETRLRVQEFLRDFIQKISMDVIKGEYTVHFKGSKKTLNISNLSKFGFTANGHKYRMLAGILKYEDGLSDKQISNAMKETRQKSSADQ